MTTKFRLDFYRGVPGQPDLMLLLEAVEPRDLKPSLSHGVLGPELSHREGLSMGNPIRLCYSLSCPL